MSRFTFLLLIFSVQLAYLMDSIINDIIKNCIPCYFISPTPRDAIQAAGGLISYLAPKTKVTLISVFTKSDELPYTKATRRFLKGYGYIDAKQMFAAWVKEDEAACRLAGVDYISLGFINGLWRKKEFPGWLPRFLGIYIPELIHLYPFGRITGDVLSRGDKNTIQEVQKKLLSFIPKANSFAVFCPAATGSSMDQLVIRNVCVTSFPFVIYWQDFSSTEDQKRHTLFLETFHLTTYIWDKPMEKKKKIIHSYQTRLSATYLKQRTRIVPEIYYL